MVQEPGAGAWWESWPGPGLSAALSPHPRAVVLVKLVVAQKTASGLEVGGVGTDALRKGGWRLEDALGSGVFLPLRVGRC